MKHISTQVEILSLLSGITIGSLGMRLVCIYTYLLSLQCKMLLFYFFCELLSLCLKDQIFNSNNIVVSEVLGCSLVTLLCLAVAL